MTLRDARKQRGWSQRELARRAGCSQPLISIVETSLPRILAALTTEDK